MASKKASRKPARKDANSRRFRRLRRILVGAAALVVVVLGGGLTVGCCVLSAPGYEGPESDHFDGEVFFNEGERKGGRWTDFLRWRMTRDLGPWPEYEEIEPGLPPPERVGRGELRVTFVNHATTLVQMDGLNVLTDPVWSDRVSPFSWVGPRRNHPPGLRLEDLPPIDVVLISHNHYDALDVDTLRQLVAQHRPRVLVGLGIGAYLDEEEIAGGEDFDWWDAAEVGPGVTATCVPVRHFSGRGLCDRDATLWAGWVLTGPGGPVFFSGDTGWGAHFARIRERFGPMRLALLPIGSYRPQWFMAPMHIGPADAVRAHGALEANTSVGIHYGTFALADDGKEEPLEDLEAALEAAGAPRPRFWTLRPGEGRAVPPLER